jgi:dolichol kinase
MDRPKNVLEYTGVLALGVGDALVRSPVRFLRRGDLCSRQASIVGKRMGRHRWTLDTNKTLEGSAAFTVSVVVCVCILRAVGVIDSFSVSSLLLSLITANSSPPR